jgi:hypothetical protein
LEVPMTTITLYGGVNEIGGCKILVEDGEARIFLDFGRAFGRYSDYFDGVFVRERTARGCWTSSRWASSPAGRPVPGRPDPRPGLP